MASTVAGGLFNAFAFAGAGYLFKMINSDGYSEEIKRHNLAMEQLTRAQQKWNQKEIEEERRVRTLRQEKSDANEDFSDINKPLKNYKKVMEIVHNGNKFAQKPHLWDYGRVRRLFLDYYKYISRRHIYLLTTYVVVCRLFRCTKSK